MATKRKNRSLLELAAEEAGLLNEFWMIAVSDAFQRHLMARIVGRPASEVLDLYFSEHPHMKRFYDRHVEAGTCTEGIAELRNEDERNRPSPCPAALPASAQEQGFAWADDFRNRPSGNSARTANESSAPGGTEDLVKRPRGRRPVKRLSVLTAMRAHDQSDLISMTEEVMSATFGASRDVCRKARNDLLTVGEQSKK